MIKPRALDYALLVLALFAFTGSPVFIRYSQLPPALIVAGRLLITLIIFLPFWLRERPRLNQTMSWPLFFSGLMLGIHFVLWTLCLEYTSITSASIAVNVSPIFVILIAKFFLKKPIGRKALAGLAAAFWGSALLRLDDLLHSQHGAIGIGLALSGALLFAIYILIGERARQTQSLMIYVVPVYTVGMCVAFAWGWIQGHPPWELLYISTHEWFNLLMLALLPTILGHTCFNYLLKSFSATTLSIVSLTEPFIASLIAMALFNEIPTRLGIAGGCLSLFGVYWVLRGTNDLKLPAEPD